MATHSSTLAWKTPWTEEPGRLQSVGSQSQTRLSTKVFKFVRYHHLNRIQSHVGICKGRYLTVHVGEEILYIYTYIYIYFIYILYIYTLNGEVPNKA